MLLCGTAAAQCVPRTIFCGDVLRGALTPNDCQRADLTPEDTFVFSGTAGQFVNAVVYTAPNGFHPDLGLVSPDGKTAYRIIGGTGGSALAYTLPSTGQWKLTLGTHDGLAPDYVIALSCHAPPHADHPDCVDQNLLCGQTVEASLTLNGCRFFNALERIYAGGWFSGTAGETFFAVIESSDFDPQIGFYSERLGDPIAKSTPTTPGRDQISFELPYTGRYYALVTAKRDGFTHTGRYRWSIGKCASAGCLPPVIVVQPADVAVPFGARTTLSVTALGLGPLHYLWADRTYLPEPPFVEGQRFITPPITARRSFAVTVDAPCGSVDSRLVTVTPREGRPRAARH